MSKETNSNKIAQYIMDDYLFNKDYVDKDEILKNIDVLIENDLAVKIIGAEYIDLSYYLSRYRVASKFMIKYNKELKKRKYDYTEKYNLSDTDKGIIDLRKYQLDLGVHYADLGDEDNDDYAICIISNPEEDDNTYIKYELYIIGHRCHKFKKKFLKMCKKYEKLVDKTKCEYITYSDGRPLKNTVFKSFDQMVFSNKDNIIKYIDNFVKNIPEYSKYGMIPKLSILLYGDPGTGKSTFYKALAKYLDIENVNVMLPDYFMMSNESDQSSRRRVTPGRFTASVSIIDDIDCIAKSRDEDDSNDNGQVLSSLLEFLDNPPTFLYKANDGLYYPISIVVATTNYIDRLDDAVKRYGRFDLKINMKPFNYNEAVEMCNIYNLNINDVITEKINKKEFSISPAYLQALCMENIDLSLKDINNK